MTCEQVVAELKTMGSENIKRIYINHGATEPLFGVKVEQLKHLQRKIRKDHELSLQLYNTGISDAQYLAGLVADEDQITKQQLQQWADEARWYLISEYTVPWVAAESHYGYELALNWIKDDRENVQAAGWSTLASLTSIKKDEELETEHLHLLLKYIEKNIHEAKNRTRYNMNGFVIAAGSFVSSLTQDALLTAQKIGKVEVSMAGTACKVPPAADYIKKIMDRGTIGKKKKKARC